MRSRSTVLASVTLLSCASLAPLLSACVSDDNAGPVVGDSGTFSAGDSGIPSFDATVSSDDASTSSDAGSHLDSAPSTGSDSSAPVGDGGTPVCAASQRIDLDAGVEPGQAIGSVANGSQRAALWGSWSPWEADGKGHIRASVFAGGDAGLFDLGWSNERGNIAFVTDQNNHAFAQWVAADAGGARSLYDFTSFTAPTSFATNANSSTSFLSLAPLPDGALSLYLNALGNQFLVDQSTGTSAWSNVPLDGGAEVANVRPPALVTNAAGQAVAAWGQSGAGGTSSFAFTLATYGGKTWSPSFTQTMTSDGGPDGAPYNMAVVILANGDAKVFFFYNDHVTAQVFSATTQQFVGAAEVVVAPGLQIVSLGQDAQLWVTIDASDNVTLVVPMFPEGGVDQEIFGTRSSGGTWSALADIGQGSADGMRVALRPSGGAVVATTGESSSWISAVGPTGNAWSAPASFQTPRDVNDLGAMTFDATHVYVLDSQVVVPSQSALGLFVEVCTL